MRLLLQSAPRERRDAWFARRAAQRAHLDWVQRGRTGDGRFDVAGVSARHGRFDGMKAAGGRFERVDFRDGNFNLSDWSETEIIRCNLNATSINEGMPLEVTRTELKMSGVPSPVSDVESRTPRRSSPTCQIHA